MHARPPRLALPWLLALVALAGCGARSGLDAPDAARRDALDVESVFDARGLDVVDVQDAFDAADVRDVVDVQDARDVPLGPDACVPVDPRCGAMEVCGNGEDDDCNGRVDEGCPCTPGAVQPCFAGPPGSRGVGVCRDGSQTCSMSTSTWGECTGGIVPQPDECNGTDNLCNGCSAQRDCPIMCPGPGDPRTPDATPFDSYPLRGELFYMGAARSWGWRVQGGPCDAVSRTPSFALDNAGSRDAMFVPQLSGDYTVTLTVVTAMGTTLSCTWIVHVEGPGLRVEMCYPENTTVDLDLYLHEPGNADPWFPAPTNVFDPTTHVCCWQNCEAVLRPGNGAAPTRADWGYAPSPLDACVRGPHGSDWAMLGFCANPRLDIDNNLSKASGVPENINVDHPRAGDAFRIMVQDWTGSLAHPLVNVYCGGHRVATYGAASGPDAVAMFSGSGPPSIGAMWRVADVRTDTDASGRTTCTVTQLHPAGRPTAYDVTYDDGRF